MKNESLDLLYGSGNLYRDLGYPDADIRQLKGSLATEIIKVLDREQMTVRQAQDCTGIAAADFSRIRNADLQRFTIDRLMGIVNKLGSRVVVTVKAKPVPRLFPAKRSATLIAAEPRVARYGQRKAKT